MGAILALLGVLLLLVSVVSLIILGFKKLVRKGERNNGVLKFKNIILAFVASIVLIIVGGALSPEEENNNKANGSNESTKKEKKDEKPLYSFDSNETKADKDGKFKVVINVEDGVTPSLKEATNVSLKKESDKKYILNGIANKNEQTETYSVEFKSANKTQQAAITIDNALAKDAYVQKQIAEKEKKEKEAKAAAEKKEKDLALTNEKNISYGMLNKSKDKYVGKPYHITKGYVMQAMEEDGKTTLLVQVTNKGYGFWDDIIAVYYPKSTDAVDEDFVEVWGTIGEKWDYTTKIGGTNSVPTIQAESVKLIK